MIDQLRSLRCEREEAQLATLAAHAELTFGKQDVLRIKSQYFGGPESMHEHQAHDSQVARVMETGPEACHLIDGERDNGELGFLHSQSAEFEPGPTEAQRPAVQVDLLESRRGLIGCVWELVADGTIGTSDAVVDSGSRRWRLPAGLEAQVIEQGRISEVFPGDVAGMVDALPPAHEVQQAVRVAIQGGVCEAADILAVQKAVDPVDASAGRLLDHLIRAVCARWGFLVDDAEVHGCAASNRDANPCASPP